MEIYLPDTIESVDDLSIRPTFHSYSESENIKSHLQTMKEVLVQLLPKPLPFSDREGLKQWIQRDLPLVETNDCGILPDTLSIFFLCHQITPINNIQKFLFDLTKRCLFNEEIHKITSFAHMDIYFEHDMDTPLVIAEVKIVVQYAREYERIKERIPYLKKQVVIATQHRAYSASLDHLWLYGEENKHSNIRDLLLRCIAKFPKYLNTELLVEHQLMQMSLKKEFFTQRSVFHLVRSVISLSIIRNNLINHMTFFIEKRHMNFRLLRTYRYFPFGKKPVLAIIVGINLLDKNEYFDEKQVALSVKKLIPNAKVVQGSTYIPNPKNSQVVTTYIEMEKEDGSDFSFNQMKNLRSHLKKNLGKRIEKLVPSLFVIRNEEETMRNILILSQEIKAVSDIPQVMISFDRHSTEDLRFIVILLRVVRPDEKSVSERLKNASGRIKCQMDRVQTVNYIKGAPLEASVFQLKITNISDFLRMDFSVNVYLARQSIIRFLEQGMGEFRDYNGGMILKQQELLGQIKRLFSEHEIEEQEILESAYYSLSPIETQATLPLNFLCMFLEVFLEHFKSVSRHHHKNHLLIKDNQEGIYVVFSSITKGFNDFVSEKNGELLTNIISSQMAHDSRTYCSYLWTDVDEEKKEAIKHFFEEANREWNSKHHQKNIVRFPVLSVDMVLDPRRSLEVNSSFMVRHLFEGLYSTDVDGKPQLALAEKETMSPCQTIYRFDLRNAYWSNGDRVVAYDFLYSWRKLLMPNTPDSFYKSLLYCIKGAKEANEKKIPIEEVGIYVLGDTTLEVHLCNPHPFFRHLLASTLVFPVNHRVDIQHPDWYERSGDMFVSNGAFTLKQRIPNHIVMQKNQLFWDAKSVKPDELYFYGINSAERTYDLFSKGKIDFCNKLFMPTKQREKASFQTVSSSANKVLWLVINTDKYPFTNKKIRQALSLVLEKNELKTLLAEDSEVANTILPKTVTNLLVEEVSDAENLKKGKQLFAEGLKELGVSVDQLPKIELIHIPIAINTTVTRFCKLQWTKHLGLSVSTESYEWDNIFKKLSEKNFCIAISFWFSFYTDALYTLNTFRFKEDRINFSGYEDPQYISLLERCEQELDMSKRQQFLIEAEKMIEEARPVIPIAYLRDINLYNPELENVGSMYRGIEKDLRKIYSKKRVHKIK
ncbi:hypothetical protein COB21_05190 [Candidatus Aerophobetes bacterium]|uniref:Solute-binding protein family 5 domain-containing protein n=1 Tax=Aerophobetes bacterium TaxID=2030807 RepID=A0A2A4X183_UNCAE|nr:MAG: hypothetical protein COB21_05190 [Candidatus Aerophobetes bacterium]